MPTDELASINERIAEFIEPKPLLEDASRHKWLSPEEQWRWSPRERQWKPSLNFRNDLNAWGPVYEKLEEASLRDEWVQKLVLVLDDDLPRATWHWSWMMATATAEQRCLALGRMGVLPGVEVTLAQLEPQEPAEAPVHLNTGRLEALEQALKLRKALRLSWSSGRAHISPLWESPLGEGDTLADAIDDMRKDGR